MAEKILYCVSDIEKALAFEWITDHLDRHKFCLVFILINCKRDSDISRFLENRNIKTYHLSFKNNLSYFRLIVQIFFILKKEKTKIIHCHLLKANIAGLTAAYIAKLPIRLHTRHHSDFNYIYSKKGIWIDRYCNSISTRIIAISKVVEDILTRKERVSQEKVQIIHHGFDLGYFSKYSLTILNQLKSKYNPKDKSPVIGVISRFTEYKGLQYTIPAFNKLLSKYPNALLLLFNARGEYTGVLDPLLAKLPHESYEKIQFENNLSEVYRLFDCFVHIPDSYYSEAFGQVYVEALICAIPSLFTLSGIAPDLVKNEFNAIIVDYKNIEETYLGIIKILENSELRNQIIENCQKTDYFEFSLEKYIFSLERLYQINSTDASH